MDEAPDAATQDINNTRAARLTLSDSSMSGGLIMKRVSRFRASAISLLTAFVTLLCSAGVGFAQDTLTKGGISGRVTDSAGAAIANAKVTITGPTGDRTVTANAQGEFELQN